MLTDGFHTCFLVLLFQVSPAFFSPAANWNLYFFSSRFARCIAFPLLPHLPLLCSRLIIVKISPRFAWSAPILFVGVSLRHPSSLLRTETQRVWNNTVWLWFDGASLRMLAPPSLPFLMARIKNEKHLHLPKDAFASVGLLRCVGCSLDFVYCCFDLVWRPPAPPFPPNNTFTTNPH